MKSLKLDIQEITDNRLVAEIDVWEQSFYLRQTYERTALLVNNGYLASEGAFRSDDEEVLETLSFDVQSQKHMQYAQNNLGHNLQKLRAAIDASSTATFILEDEQMSQGCVNGGLNDFIEETVLPILPVRLLDSYCMMETGLNTQLLYRLCLHFFAKAKLDFNDIKAWPEFWMMDEVFTAFGIDTALFSFRELTLLGGFKTERAVRNLASPSTPEHRRLRVIKNGRLTGIEPAEVRRWLQANR